jgi:hypothetical protein
MSKQKNSPIGDAEHLRAAADASVATYQVKAATHAEIAARYASTNPSDRVAQFDLDIQRCGAELELFEATAAGARRVPARPRR